MMKYKIHILILALIALVQMKAQTGAEKITGSWTGPLKVAGKQLDLVFTFSASGQSVTTLLDVPAQGARNVPASKTVLGGDSIFIEFAMMRASFKGVYKADSALISGSWKQNMYALPLKLLQSSAKEKVVKHLQEPVKPYPYNEEEIVFENTAAKLKLAGTFTWPKDKSNYPAVVLVSGSGPQNRDEEILGQKPFLVLADYLTRQGIAVLRYDDRGTGASAGNFKNATTFDFASDAAAAVDYLRTRKGIDKKKIGLLGHSEGGLVAPIVASSSKQAAFIVLLAGPGLRGDALIAKQSSAIAEAAGASDEQAELSTRINKKVYAMAIRNSSQAGDSIRFLLQAAGMPAEGAKAQAAVLLSLWYRMFLVTDPAFYLQKVNCPVLALNGKKDLQVTYPDNLEAVDKALSNNKRHTIKAYDNLNHLFQHCTSCSIEEYGEIEETMSGEVMKDIADWILQLR